MTFQEIQTAAFLAYKTILRGSRSTTILLTFVLALSFLNMLFVSGMLFGLQKLMVNTIIDMYSSHVMISPQETPRVKAYIPDQQNVQAQIRNIPGVIATSRHYQLAGSLLFDKLKNGVYKQVSGPIVGIDPDVEKNVLTVDRFLLAGRWLDPGDHDQIILSSALAGGYGVFAPSDLGGVQVGDKVRVAFSNGVTRTYTVKGIYDDAIGLFETFITTDEAESILSVYNQASQILVKADLSRVPLDTLAQEVKETVPDLKVQPYTFLLGSFAAFLAALDLIAAIVSAISVLVATITLFSLFTVNAVNRRRQIGILKAIGIKRSTIVLAFVLQAIFYAVVGIGIGAFLVFGVLTPYLIAHPIDVVFGKLTLINSVTTTIIAIVSLSIASFLAGLIPTWAIARGAILKAIAR